MTAHWVLDTSVVLKWTRRDEIMADRALALLSAYLHGLAQITVPALVAYEVANVLRYKTHLATGDIEAAVQALFDLGLTWATPAAAVMRRAVWLARECDTTVHDAAFAAVAEAVGADFVTADERLARRLAALPLVQFLGDVEIPA